MKAINANIRCAVGTNWEPCGSDAFIVGMMKQYKKKTPRGQGSLEYTDDWLVVSNHGIWIDFPIIFPTYIYMLIGNVIIPTDGEKNTKQIFMDLHGGVLTWGSPHEYRQNILGPDPGQDGSIMLN